VETTEAEVVDDRGHRESQKRNGRSGKEQQQRKNLILVSVFIYKLLFVFPFWIGRLIK
jgi:hypothetical protein